jgi:hypothetical protein
MNSLSHHLTTSLHGGDEASTSATTLQIPEETYTSDKVESFSPSAPMIDMSDNAAIMPQLSTSVPIPSPPVVYSSNKISYPNIPSYEDNNFEKSPFMDYAEPTNYTHIILTGIFVIVLILIILYIGKKIMARMCMSSQKSGSSMNNSLGNYMRQYNPYTSNVYNMNQQLAPNALATGMPARSAYDMNN